MTTSSRPFRVLGLQQIALGGLHLEGLHHLWVDLLGLSHVGNFQSSSENVVEEICHLGFGLGRVEVDLMRPLVPEAKPQVHVPALNHIGLWVDDLPLAVQWLGSQGVRFAPGGIRKGASGHDICFVHPKGNDQFPQGGEGVLIELVQAPRALIEAMNADLAKDLDGLEV
jgi:lactoylglutathione lyase